MTVSQVEFDALKVETAALRTELAEMRKLLGANYLNTPQPQGRTEDQLKAHFFSTWAVPENELESGDYPLSILQKQNTYIIADLRREIAALTLEPDETQVPDGSSIDTQAIVNQVTEAVLTALPSGTTDQNPGALIARDESGGGHFAELSFGRLLLKANTQRLAMQHGITDERLVELLCNGWDGGARIGVNWDHVTSRYLPMHIFGFNGWGSFEVNWFPPLENWQGMVRGDVGRVTKVGDPLYDFYRGQGFIADLGAQSVYKYGTWGESGEPLSQARHLMLGTQRKGWPIFLVVSPHRGTDGNTPLNWAVASVDSDGGPDPFSVVAEGRLQRVVVKTINGERVFAPA